MALPDNWTVADDGNSASIELTAKNFLDALDLFNRIGPVAEELDHHPDLHLTGYKKVRIVTWSHDKGTLTERDERLAARINALLGPG